MPRKVVPSLHEQGVNMGRNPGKAPSHGEMPTVSRCGPRKNYVPSPEGYIDLGRCRQEGVRWNPSALNAGTIWELSRL
jgi:hypothetical protein